MKKILSLFTVLLSTVIFAQTNVSGSVTDENNSPIPGANIVVDQTTGAVSNFDGEFSLKVSQNPPFDIKISSVGFETKTITINIITTAEIILITDTYCIDTCCVNVTVTMIATSHRSVAFKLT